MGFVDCPPDSAVHDEVSVAPLMPTKVGLSLPIISSIFVWTSFKGAAGALPKNVKYI